MTLLSEGLLCCCLDWQLGETRLFNGIRVVKRSVRTRRRRTPLRPKVQAGPNHSKFQSLACQTRVCEAFAPNSPRAGGDEVLDAGAHAGCPGKHQLDRMSPGRRIPKLSDGVMPTRVTYALPQHSDASISATLSAVRHRIHSKRQLAENASLFGVG